MSSELKTCRGCKRALPHEAFYRLAKGRDGLHPRCKSCHQVSIESTDGYTAKHRARVMLNRARREGSIKAPDSCNACGAVVSPDDIDGHHEDYSKPLEVRWLCRACHEFEHRRVLVAFGESLTLDEWSARTGLPKHRISNRLWRGWSPEEALSPVRSTS